MTAKTSMLPSTEPVIIPAFFLLLFFEAIFSVLFLEDEGSGIIGFDDLSLSFLFNLLPQLGQNLSFGPTSLPHCEQYVSQVFNLFLYYINTYFIILLNLYYISKQYRPYSIMILRFVFDAKKPGLKVQSR